MVGGVFNGAMYWVFDDMRLKAIDAWVQLTRKSTPVGNPWAKPEFRKLVECVARSQGFHGTALEWQELVECVARSQGFHGTALEWQELVECAARSQGFHGTALESHGKLDRLEWHKRDA
jgi:hypothetical protein